MMKTKQTVYASYSSDGKNSIQIEFARPYWLRQRIERGVFDSVVILLANSNTYHFFSKTGYTVSDRWALQSSRTNILNL